MDPGARFRFQIVVVQRQARFALKKVQHSRHRGRVFGKLLALGEAEEDRFKAVVVKQGAAQDAFVGRLDLFRQIAKVGVFRDDSDGLNMGGSDGQATVEASTA